MRRALFLSVAMLAQPALAGDWLPEMELRPQADWTGAYVGATGGAGISAGRAKLDHAEGVLIPFDIGYGLFPHGIRDSSAGVAAGVSAGINFQSGAFVGGIEADIGYVSTKAHHGFSRLDDTHNIAPLDIHTNTRYETSFGMIGTLRARGGYAFGNTLLFGTAGIAAGDVGNRFQLAMPEIGYASPDWSASGLRLGYVIGAGVEHRLTDAISFKFETLYLNLADRVVKAVDPAAFPGESISYRFTNDVVMPRFGMNVKF